MDYTITVFLCLFLVFLIVFFTTVIILVMRNNRYQARIVREQEENLSYTRKQKDLGKKEYTFHNGKVRLYARNYLEAHTAFERCRGRDQFGNKGDTESLSA